MNSFNEAEGIEFGLRAKSKQGPTISDLLAARRAFGANHAFTYCILDILEWNRNKRTAQKRLSELWDLLSPRALSLIKQKVNELEGDADFASTCEGLDIDGTQRTSNYKYGGKP